MLASVPSVAAVLTFASQLTLKELESRLEQVRRAQAGHSNRDFVFDLRCVAWIDIASVLFLLVILSLLRADGHKLTLLLPEGTQGKKARDFLRRWKFFQALEDNIDRVENLLPSDQLEQYYFREEQSYYLPASVESPNNVLEALISKRLMEITSFAYLQDGGRRISLEAIDRYISDLKKTIVAPILKSVIGSCESQDDFTELFADVLVREALWNSYEHPMATFSAISMAREGKNFVVAVADNGLTIPATIRETYSKHERKSDVQLLEGAFNNDELYGDLFRKITDQTLIEFATQPGVTSKPDTSSPTRGMGLYYLKSYTTSLGGTLTVRSGEASVKFSRDVAGEIVVSGDPRIDCRGTLIKIVLPIAESKIRK